MGIFDRFTGASEESEELLKEIRALSQDNLVLAESYSALARATLEFDEKGWSPLNQLSDNGIRLEDVKTISKQARRQTASNPVLKRGAMLRASYVFGRGFKMSQSGNVLAPRFQRIIDDPVNQNVLFSESASKKNERALFTDGNFFVRYDKRNRRFSRVPLEEIAGWATDPDDPELIRYYLREYQVREPVTDPYNSYLAETRKVWYPLDYVENPVAQINDIPVDRNMVIIDPSPTMRPERCGEFPMRFPLCRGRGHTPSTSRTVRRCSRLCRVSPGRSRLARLRVGPTSPPSWSTTKR
jgi:hypothetical protein